MPISTGGSISRGWAAWLPLAVAPGAVFVARNWMPAWIFMWALAVAIFAGCKSLALSKALAGAPRGNGWRFFGFLFLWPGMDAATFLHGAPVRAPGAREWLSAAATTTLGAALYWGVARHAHRELPAGWIGMVGLILLLHFGSFRLLALAWQICGVNAQPLMRAPARATSLSEFWGRRWNNAFNSLAHEFIFRPLAGRIGIRGAMISAFFVSGLIHDAVISIPAGAGYGLPTLYFVVQSAGFFIERSHIGRTIGLGKGVPGWLFTVVLTAGPAFWLFHPPFVLRIIVPMMKALRAL